MKENMWRLISLAAVTVLLAACTDELSDPSEGDGVEVKSGVLILNEGSLYASPSIMGSLDFFNFKTGVLERNIFETVNKRSLGGTPNHAIVVAGKLFIATTDENRVEIVSLPSLEAAEPVTVVSPRELATDGRAVYVSSYDGTVSKIDIATGEVLARSAKVGDNLEGIACANGMLYVCNSYAPLAEYPYADYHNNLVKLNTNDLSKSGDIEVALNPNQVVAAGNKLYVASWGDYGMTPATIQQVDVATEEVKTLSTGRLFAYNDGKLYFVRSSYNEYWQEVSSFLVFDLQTGTESTFTEGTEIFAPCGIVADSRTGDIYISSYVENPDTHAANYAAEGYVVRYHADGTYVDTYNVGTGPATMIVLNE